MREWTFLLVVAVACLVVAYARLAGRLRDLEAWARSLDDWNHEILRKLEKLRQGAVRAPEAPPRAASSVETPPAEERRPPAPSETAPRTRVDLPSPPAERPTPALEERAARPAAPPSASPVARPLLPEEPRSPTPPVETPRAARAASGADRGFDWEAIVGVRLFSWIAGIALVLAALFFLRYSVERGWLGPPARMTLGIASGLALLVFCELRAARRYAVTANALGAAGIAILFASFYAGHALWGLVGALPTFGLLALVTALAVLLSARHGSLFMALLGLLGGFATPALLASGEDRPIGLFGYLFLLNLGLVWVAYRRHWPVLKAISLALTALYQVSWATRFLSVARLPLGLAIFALFAIVALFALLLGERRAAAGADATALSPFFERTALGAVLVPLSFTFFLASDPAYGARFALTFAYLGLLLVGLFAFALLRRRERLHLAGGGAVLLAWWVWIARSYSPAHWPGVLLLLSLFALFLLLSPLVARWLGRPFTGAGLRAARLGALLTVAFPLLVVREPASAAALLPFGTLAALVAVAAAVALALEDAAVFYFAAAAAVVSEALWSAYRWTAASGRATPFFLYLLFAALPLGVPVLAHRRGRRFAPEGAGALLGLAGPLLLLAAALRPALAMPPWWLLGSLLLLDALFVLAALAGRRAEPALAALLLSQLIVGVWLRGAKFAPWPLVALAAALAVGAVALGALALLPRFEIPDRSAGPFIRAALLALVGGQIVAAVTAGRAGAPAFVWYLAAALAFATALLSLAARTGWSAIVPLAALTTAVEIGCFGAAHAPWWQSLVVALGGWFPFLVYPLVASERVRRSREPYVALLLSGAATLAFGRAALLDGGHGSILGLLPLAQAALLVPLLMRLLRSGSAEERAAGRETTPLVLVAAGILAGITVAIPLQFEKEWLTLGWALLGAALVWLERRIPHPGLLVWAVALEAAAFVRLALNPAVLTYHPRQATPILNWYLYAYLVAAGAMFVAARWLRGRRLSSVSFAPTPWLAASGTVLLFLLLNVEIADFFSVGEALTFGFWGGRAGLSEDLAYTFGWALFAIGLLAAGVVGRARAARICAIALLAFTVVKAFLHDTWRLGGLYRVGSLVGLAVSLALVALVLQRFVLRNGLDESAD